MCHSSLLTRPDDLSWLWPFGHIARFPAAIFPHLAWPSIALLKFSQREGARSRVLTLRGGRMSGFGGDGRLSRIVSLFGLGIGCLALAKCANGNMSSRVATTDAKHRLGHQIIHDERIVCNERGCSDRAIRDRTAIQYVTNGDGAVVGRRPTGCPRNFCGCEASRYLFGHLRPDLNLASNWMRKFPRTSPAPGMAAVRNHHVMILMSQVDGGNWLVHDGNSGSGLTREHVRSIGGYIIVDPQVASTEAMLK